MEIYLCESSSLVLLSDMTAPLSSQITELGLFLL